MLGALELELQMSVSHYVDYIHWWVFSLSSFYLLAVYVCGCVHACERGCHGMYRGQGTALESRCSPFYHLGPKDQTEVGRQACQEGPSHTEPSCQSKYMTLSHNFSPCPHRLMTML